MGRGLGPLQLAIIRVLTDDPKSTLFDDKELIYKAYRQMGVLTPKGRALTEGQYRSFRRARAQLVERCVVDDDGRIANAS